MSRVFRAETGARRRQRMMRGMASVLRYAGNHQADEDEQRDLLAYVYFALAEIVESVDQSASAWEKRGYWVKADRFRADWRWSVDCLASAEDALRDPGQADSVDVLASLLTPLKDVQPYKRPSDQPAWRGSWKRWRAEGRD